MQIKNSNVDKISKKLNALDILNPNNNKRCKYTISARDIYLTMIDMTYTPPLFGFIYLLVSSKYPYKTYFGETTKRLEQQIREDNNSTSDVSLCNHIWELSYFAYRFTSNDQ